MDKLKLVKGIVVLLTSLIVLGIAAVIIGITGKDDKPKPPISPAVDTVSAPFSSGAGVTSSALETIIAEPMGSKIASVTGCGDNICLMVTGGGLDPRLIILNEKGAVLRKVKLSANQN